MTDSNRPDSPDYRRKKAFYDSLITIYGRKPVLEALNDKSLPVHKLHLADSNKRDGLVNEMIGLAERRGIDIAWHDRKALSRISKNGKQDQGVAADLQPQGYRPLEELLESGNNFQLLALDGVLNPQKQGFSEIPYRSDNLFRFLIV